MNHIWNEQIYEKSDKNGYKNERELNINSILKFYTQICS